MWLSTAGASTARISNVGTATVAHLAAEGSRGRCQLGNLVLEWEILIKIWELKKYGINFGVGPNSSGIKEFM